MKKTFSIFLNFSIIFMFCFTYTRPRAQGISTPLGGGNQKASVSQWIGLVKVRVNYNSPDGTDA